ncbi:MAG: class I SAM-dependent methyltransferase [Paracoccaceae bacterium]|nr:MAG: class I SAM-dependent methyltransferase [Paracoccaceae bacterium]
MPFADPAHIDDMNLYLGDRIAEVNGWCGPHLWQALWPVARAIGQGPVAEIGVFEGKFLIGLVKTFDPDAVFSHAAIDVYDMQQFNLDGAGVGKAAVLDTNLKAHGLGAHRVEKVRADSLALRAADAAALVARHGQFKFFSVDGCHEVTHTMNDIEFAMQVTAPEGLISVDDYLNPSWPGVSEAVAKMYLLRNFAFVPLFYTMNKLFLCSISYHDTYLKLLQKSVVAEFPGTPVKPVTRFGFRTLTILPRIQSWLPLRAA